MDFREAKRTIEPKREADLERYFVRKIKALGGCARKLTSRNGDPDRLVLIPGGHAVFVELKTLNGKLTKNQIVVQNGLSDLGFYVFTLYGKKQVDWFLGSVFPRFIEE